jgi:hypothetical protein
MGMSVGWDRCECGQHPGTFSTVPGHMPSGSGACYADGQAWPCDAAREAHEQDPAHLAQSAQRWVR